MQVLDDKEETYYLLDKNNEIVITIKEPITINRLMLQEAISTHSERIEKHAVDVWVDNEWRQITEATNIGYKRILRFPEVTTSKIRVRVLESRMSPAISHISAHYYVTRPPQLSLTRDIDGMVTIEPMQTVFNWNPHGENAASNLNSGYEIFYTLDGSEPTNKSIKYENPIRVENNIVRAVSYNNDNKGSESSQEFGILKKEWTLLDYTSERSDRYAAKNAIDASSRTFWHTEDGLAPFVITLDLGSEYDLKEMVYTPQTFHADGMMEGGVIEISKDAKNWERVEKFEFGNLINDPTPRSHKFSQSVNTRYIRVIATDIAGGSTSLAIAEIDFL